MSLSCRQVEPLLTPFVDGQLLGDERGRVAQHLDGCPTCASRVSAERAVCEMLATRRMELRRGCAPAALRERCRSHGAVCAPIGRLRGAGGRWSVTSMAVAAVLALAVGGAVLALASARSTGVLAAELAADHLKCLALNAALGTRHSHEAVEASMVSQFAWPVRLPAVGQTQMELVGSRPCVYGAGRMAHLMFRDRGEPVSIFMLPGSARAAASVAALGQRCIVWPGVGRTYVLVARREAADVDRLAHEAQRTFR